MIAALSKFPLPSDTFDRPQTSIAHRLDDASDADIHNLVEGYRAETEVINEGYQSFERWWLSIDERERGRRDARALWNAYRAGWLAMARELGQLPPAAGFA